MLLVIHNKYTLGFNFYIYHIQDWTEHYNQSLPLYYRMIRL